MAGLSISGTTSVSAVAVVLSAILLSVEARAQLVLPGAVPPAAETPPRPSAPRPARAPRTDESPQTPAAQPPASAPGAASRPAPAPVAPLPEGVIGETLFHGGRPQPESGTLTITELRPGLIGLHLNAGGRQITNPAGQCAIDLGSDRPVPLLPIAEPYRASRYRLQSSACPIVVEMLEHSVRISIPDGECSFAQADCHLSPEGLWGPPGEELVARTGSIERRRGRAERELREVSRSLLRRLTGDEQRQAAAEQAAFSSERTTVCRNYVAEDRHGFCAAELTVNRVDRLKKRYEETPPRPARGR